MNPIYFSAPVEVAQTPRPARPPSRLPTREDRPPPPRQLSRRSTLTTPPLVTSNYVTFRVKY